MTADLDNVEAHWGIAFHYNSQSPRSVKWYRVSRLVHADGKWFELYWHLDIQLRGKNYKEVRERALNSGLHLLHGVFCNAPSPRHGSVMQWSIGQFRRQHVHHRAMRNEPPFEPDTRIVWEDA